jgi:hypothetical protein
MAPQAGLHNESLPHWRKRSLEGAREDSTVKSAQSIKTVCVLVLLAVLVSYSLDLECLLETQTCQQQIQSAHNEPDTSCAQPSLLPAVVAVALLQTTSSFVSPIPYTLERVLGQWRERSVVGHSHRLIPLGLRAPPSA